MSLTTTRRGIVRVSSGTASTATDAIAVEAPLTLVIDGQAVATTMRTPGHDTDLAAGWLVNESRVRRADDIRSLAVLAAPTDSDDADPSSTGPDDDLRGIDTARIALAPHVERPRPRAFLTSSSCGICSTDLLAAFDGPPAPLHTPDWRLDPAAVPRLVEGMRLQQRMFDRTGALHAAALVDPLLQVMWVREDVGRHNAVDKVIGHALLTDRLPLTDHVLVVSGRISYEIVHKALTASLAAIVAVSGPSSLAIDLAREHGLVLIGFSRGDAMNVYAGEDRVAGTR